MASVVNNSDLDAQELISALNSIETESLNHAEVQLLRDENRRLREELIQRHRNRINELQEFEELLRANHFGNPIMLPRHTRSTASHRTLFKRHG